MSLNRQVSIDGHLHMLTVRSGERGWDVIEEKDFCVINRLHHEDWHKVETALMLFEIKIRDGGGTPGGSMQDSPSRGRFEREVSARQIRVVA